MTREQAINFMVSRGYIKADAEELPTSMLIDMVTYTQSLNSKSNAMSREQALAFLGFFAGKVGAGYHPDNSLDEYSTDWNGFPLFSQAELDVYAPIHEQMIAVLGDEAYAYCLTLLGIGGIDDIGGN